MKQKVPDATNLYKILGNVFSLCPNASALTSTAALIDAFQTAEIGGGEKPTPCNELLLKNDGKSQKFHRTFCSHLAAFLVIWTAVRDDMKTGRKLAEY